MCVNCVSVCACELCVCGCYLKKCSRLERARDYHCAIQSNHTRSNPAYCTQCIWCQDTICDKPNSQLARLHWRTYIDAITRCMSQPLLLLTQKAVHLGTSTTPHSQFETAMSRMKLICNLQATFFDTFAMPPSSCTLANATRAAGIPYHAISTSLITRHTLTHRHTRTHTHIQEQTQAHTHSGWTY